MHKITTKKNKWDLEQLLAVDAEPLETYLNQDSFVKVDGKITHMHGFGDMIGQSEIDSQFMKSLKGDVYILTTGLYNL